MRTDTGEIFEAPKGRAVPMPSVPLNKEEAFELKTHTSRGRLRRYKQNHADDDCRSCGKKLRVHTLREFQSCYSE